MAKRKQTTAAAEETITLKVPAGTRAALDKIREEDGHKTLSGWLRKIIARAAKLPGIAAVNDVGRPWPAKDSADA